MVNKSKFKSKNKKLKILLNYKDRLIKEKIKNTIMQGGMQKRKKFRNLKSEKKPKKESRIILNHKRRFVKESIIQQNKTIQEKKSVKKLRPIKRSFKLERISKKEIRDFSEKVKKNQE